MILKFSLAHLVKHQHKKVSLSLSLASLPVLQIWPSPVSPRKELDSFFKKRSIKELE